jgi:hypothetical protein
LGHVLWGSFYTLTEWGRGFQVDFKTQSSGVQERRQHRRDFSPVSVLPAANKDDGYQVLSRKSCH